MLEVKDIVKSYKSKSGVTVKALKGISLKFPDKGMIFILGKSGSGKSTLLNVLGGLDSFDEGEIIIKGKSSKTFKNKDFDSYRNTYLGFIFQEYNILDNFTVGQNIALAMKLQGKKPTSEEINKILKQVDLDGLGDRKPNELSGGQKQRVAIARALIKNPQIIMADEPTGALDSKTGIQIFDTLKSLSKDKLVIIVSHDREFSERYADRIIELKDGNILSDVSLQKSSKNDLCNVIYTGSEVLVRNEYQLTSKDLKEINAFLKKCKNGISIKPGEISQRSKSSFVKTDESKISTKDNDFKLIKSRLPFSHAFKMGAGGLKHKKIKLGFTILLSLISFTMLGMTSSLMLFKPERSLAENWKTNEAIDFYNIGKCQVMKSNGFFSGTQFNYSVEGFSTSDETERNKVAQSMPVQNHTYIYSMSNGYYSDSYYESDQKLNSLYPTNFRYIGKEADFKAYFESNLVGQWPSQYTEGTEPKIVIPRAAAQGFIKYGLKNPDTYGKYEDITSFDKFVGKKISIGGTKYIISGVLNGGLDIDNTRYRELINSSFEKIHQNKFYQEYENLKEYSCTSIAILSDSEYATQKSNSSSSFIFGALPTNSSDISKLAKFTYTENSVGGLTYVYCSSDAISNGIRNIYSMASSMSKVFLIIGLAFVVFSGLLLANFIANSISYQKKEIGILRAIGSRSSDVFKVYMCESGIIAIFNFILATISSSLFIKFVLNNSMTSMLGNVSILTFGALEILILFGVSIVSAFLSTFIPVYLTAKKKPVEAIRNK